MRCRSQLREDGADAVELHPALAVEALEGHACRGVPRVALAGRGATADRPRVRRGHRHVEDAIGGPVADAHLQQEKDMGTHNTQSYPESNIFPFSLSSLLVLLNYCKFSTVFY